MTLPARALAQIKRQQSHSAADIQDRRGRGTQEFVSRRINPVAPQLAADVTAEPTFLELDRYARTRIFVFRRVSIQGFHLRRLIALPD